MRLHVGRIARHSAFGAVHMNSFSFHVPASNYRRRPAVRLAVGVAGNPFGSRWQTFMAALARMVAYD